MTPEEVEISKLRAELARERAASAALRKELLTVQHKACVERGRCKSCEYHPQTLNESDHA